MAWYNDNWENRRKLTIDHTKIPSDQNVVLPIFLDTGNFDFSKIQDNGEDFRVTDSDGETLLPYEIEEIKLATSGDGLDDGSSYNHIVTAQGDAHVDSDNAKFGSSSLDLDGTGDYAEVTDDPVFDLGSNDFCFEAFVLFNTLGSNTVVSRTTSGTSYMYMTFESGTNLRFRDYTGSNVIDFTRSVSVTTGTWYHVAVTRSGNDFRMFLDGVQQGSTYTNSNAMTSRAVPIDIGHGTFNAGYAMDGRVDSLRITSGDARYTSNFTPPSSALTSDGNTILLMNFEFSSVSIDSLAIWTRVPNVSSSSDRDIYLYYNNPSAADNQQPNTVFQDFTAVWHLNQTASGVSGELVDETGNGHDATGQGTFPNSVTGVIVDALKGQGSGSYATAPDSNDLDITGDFDISWKMRWDGSVTAGSIFGKSQGGGPSPKWIINYGNLVGGAMGFHDGSSTVSWAWSPSPDTWYHCRIIRSGNDFKFFVDGSQHGSTVTSALSVPNTTQLFHFFTEGESWQWFGGRLDEVRLVNGVIEGSLRSEDFDSIEYYADSDQLLTYGSEEVQPTVQMTPELHWKTVLREQLEPQLQWSNKLSHKFVPNLLNYPFHFQNPSILTTKVPVTMSGSAAGYSIYLGDTGSSGQTTVKIYNAETLLATRTITANNSEYSKVYFLSLDNLLYPNESIKVEITEVASGAEDLKVYFYLMTYPFELDKLYFFNEINSVSFTGLNKDFLFESADNWLLQLNQPIESVDYISVFDLNDTITQITDFSLTDGLFIDSQIKFEPYTDSPVSLIRARVKDKQGVFHIFDFQPNVRPYMANIPDYISQTTAELPLFIAAQSYRYSFDGGSSWSDWAAVSDDSTISINMDSASSGSINLKIQYYDGTQIIEEEKSIYHATGDINCQPVFVGQTVEPLYSDVVPYQSLDIFIDDILVNSNEEPILDGLGSLSYDNSSKSFSVASGSIYYNSEKIDYDGSSFTMTAPLLSEGVINYTALFGLNTTTKEFEVREIEDKSNGAYLDYSLDDFIPIWTVDYVVNGNSDFSSWYLFFEGEEQVYTVPQIPFQIEEDLSKTVKVIFYDVAGRSREFTYLYQAGKVNRWRSLTVTDPSTGNEILPGQIHQNSTLNYSVTTEEWNYA